MRAVCAGLAFWFAVIVITPTLDVQIASAPNAAWSSR
jgi:hypothetical protein